MSVFSRGEREAKRDIYSLGSHIQQAPRDEAHERSRSNTPGIVNLGTRWRSIKFDVIFPDGIATYKPVRLEIPIVKSAIFRK
jgi:hypothetical protein